MDIMIIDLDTLSYSNNYSKLITYLNAVNEDRLSREDTDFKFRIHTAGAASPEDFFRNNSIVYSSVRRAKGNESFILFDRFLKKYYADIDVSNKRMTINLTDEEGHVLSFNLSQSEVHYVLHMVERRLNSFMRDDGGGGFGDKD